MPTYVDPLLDHGWRLGKSCHLIGDTREELHTMATHIGMKRNWFQPRPPASIDHYDLTERQRNAAIICGAIELPQHDFTLKVRELCKSTITIADEIRAASKEDKLHPLVRDNWASPRGLCNCSKTTKLDVVFCTLDYGHTGLHMNKSTNGLNQWEAPWPPP